MMDKRQRHHESNAQDMAVSRRPNSVQTANMKHLPTIKETKNYIMITQDILDAFREQVVQSNKVTLKLNNVKYKERRRKSHRDRLPPVFAERLRLLHGRASTSLDLRETLPHRPVRVFVDDITARLERSVTLHETGHTESNIKASHSRRSVDSDDDGHLPDAIIEKVARANTVHNEHSQILPEIRAAPCPIHTKKDHKDPLKTDGRSPRRLTTHEPHNQLNVHTSTNKGCRMDINIRIPEQFPATVRQPMLPKNMTSKEYVMTWLVHGSEPNGNNHFPEIIPRRKKSLKVKMPDVKNS